jgi:hypothetical protein
MRDKFESQCDTFDPIGLEVSSSGMKFGWSKLLLFGNEIWLVKQILSFTSIINKFTQKLLMSVKNVSILVQLI